MRIQREVGLPRKRSDLKLCEDDEGEAFHRRNLTTLEGVAAAKNQRPGANTMSHRSNGISVTDHQIN
jgi:hypothetical protein